jgi:hypothetical protein
MPPRRQPNSAACFSLDQVTVKATEINWTLAKDALPTFPFWKFLGWRPARAGMREFDPFHSSHAFLF